jgi:hypothetical protein
MHRSSGHFEQGQVVTPTVQITFGLLLRRQSLAEPVVVAVVEPVVVEGPAATAVAEAVA